MKLSFFLGMLILSVPLLLSLPAQAAVVTVDVTIKTVNPQARGITVVYKTELGEKIIELDVSRKAEITVNAKEGTLDSLGAGLKAKVSFDRDLAIVTKIEAKGTATAAKAPELMEVSEINDEGANDHPWLSEDGLTIYWDRNTGPKGSIWTAHREKPESPFESKKSLFAGKCPTASSDGLEMILVGDRPDGGQGKQLQMARRESRAQSFSRPKEIRVLSNHNAWTPGLSSDGLTLYFNSIISRTQITPFVCTRKNASSDWSRATTLANLEFDGGPVTLSFVTADGLTILGQQVRNERSVFVVCSRSSDRKPFGEPKLIEFNKHALSGVWPRYVAATHEVFFASRGPLKDGAANKGIPIGIWVVKNLTLPE